MQTIHKGAHSSTFGGNPLACAAAIAVIDVMQSSACQSMPPRWEPTSWSACGPWALKVREVRGLGLMMGVELKEKVAPHLRALMDRGVMALAAGVTVLRFLPPLIITTDEVDTVVTQVAEVLRMNQDIELLRELVQYRESRRPRNRLPVPTSSRPCGRVDTTRLLWMRPAIRWASGAVGHARLCCSGISTPCQGISRAPGG